MNLSQLRYRAFFLFCVFLTACGGSGGDGSNTVYPVGGVITGLSGAVVLQNKGTDSLPLSANGIFTFPSALSAGSAYQVTVLTQPEGHVCVVANGTGTMSGAAVTNVTVTCAPQVPVLSLEPRSVKTFRFTWTDIPGRTEYRLLEDPDGVSGYAEIASVAAGIQRHDVSVFLPARINARYILLACHVGGCTSSAPANVVGTLAEAVGYAKASNTRAGDRFGASVALSGDTLAIGAPQEDSDSTGIFSPFAANSGAVYIFVRHGTAWVQQAHIKTSNADANDFFGASIALSGSTLAVGARYESSAATGVGGNQASNAADSSGAVYVFVRNGAAWTQQAYIKASNTDALDNFGAAVALSGDTLAVGAPFEDSAATGVGASQASNAASNSGAVYVFIRSGTAWTQQAYVKASNPGVNDHFGSTGWRCSEIRSPWECLARTAPLQASTAMVPITVRRIVARFIYSPAMGRSGRSRPT